MKKRLKIFKSPWHIAHDASLMAALSDFADFSLLVNYTRRWDERVRPLPGNTEWVTHFEPGKYDLAILNLDQQCSSPNMNKAVLPKHMRQAIEEADPNCKIVFINHATPVYPEIYQDGTKATDYVSEKLKDEILAMVKPYPMVSNSHQAAREWGYGKAIIHGLDPEEWMPAAVKEPRAVTFITEAGIGDRYYNRSFLIAVRDELIERHGVSLVWINAQGNWTAKDAKEYKDFVSKSLIYFNPTFASPMPRSRSEAMLMGCCPVTTPQHGADGFIRDGVNGFLVPPNNVEYAAKIIAYLVKYGYRDALRMGQAARETAIAEFSLERYRNDWVDFLHDEAGIDMTQYA